jgi:hypothetical protein
MSGWFTILVPDCTNPMKRHKWINLDKMGVKGRACDKCGLLVQVIENDS